MCLRLDLRATYPRLAVVPRFRRDGVRYFGPYFGRAAHSRDASRRQPVLSAADLHRPRAHHRHRPCLLYRIGRCPAPWSTRSLARSTPRRARGGDVSRGRGGGADRCAAHADEGRVQGLPFEQAARLRDQLIALQRILERQKVATTEGGRPGRLRAPPRGRPAGGLPPSSRHGRLTGGQAFHFTGQEFPDDELLGSFVNLVLRRGQRRPEEVLLPLGLRGGLGLAALVTEHHGRRVRVHVPQRGEKGDLVGMAAPERRARGPRPRRTRDEMEAVLVALQTALST